MIEYNPEWPVHFDKIKEKLLGALIGPGVCIEHIGSTAVPGLSAKPIIDIDIVYKEAPDFEYIKSRLASVGYYHNGNQDIEGREVFKRHKEGNDEILDTIVHHLYVCKYDCPELHRHILFRNYLRKHLIASDYYSNLKCSIAREAKDDRKVYAALKEVKANSFINYIIELERADYAKSAKIDSGANMS